MSKKTLLADRNNYRDLIAEQQYEFMVWILGSIPGIDAAELESCFPGAYSDFTVQHRIALRKFCDRYTIDVLDDKNGGMKIYINSDTLIAEWKKPWVVLRHDNSQINPDRRLFNEVHLDWWVAFESDTTEETNE